MLYPPMIITELFTTARIWKQPNCLLVNEWIKKTWSIFIMEYNSAKRENIILLLVKTWMDLEGMCSVK